MAKSSGLCLQWIVVLYYCIQSCTSSFVVTSRSTSRDVERFWAARTRYTSSKPDTPFSRLDGHKNERLTTRKVRPPAPSSACLYSHFLAGEHHNPTLDVATTARDRWSYPIISSVLLVATAIGSLVMTVPLYGHAGNPNSMRQGQHLVAMATQQWTGAACLGIAAYLYAWLRPPQQFQDSAPLPPCLSLPLSWGLLVFCLGGLVALPGEIMSMLHVSARAEGATAIASLFGLLALLGRILGLGTAWQGIRRIVLEKQVKEVDDTLTRQVPDEGERQQQQQQYRLSRASVNNLLSFLRRPTRKNTRQTLFYRNVLILVLGGALSNLFQTIFQLRYRTALSISYLDISQSISAISQLTFLATLIYSLKAGSKALPELLPDTNQRYAASRAEWWKKRNMVDDSALTNGASSGGQGKMDEMEHLTTFQSKKLLAKDLMKLNFLVAVWPLAVCLGRNMANRLVMQVQSLEKPEFLLLSALFALKGVRCRQLAVRGDDDGAGNDDDEKVRRTIA